MREAIKLPLPNMDLYYRNRKAEDRSSTISLGILIFAVLVLGIMVGFYFGAGF